MLESMGLREGLLNNYFSILEQMKKKETAQNMSGCSTKPSERQEASLFSERKYYK